MTFSSYLMYDFPFLRIEAIFWIVWFNYFTYVLSFDWNSFLIDFSFWSRDFLTSSKWD